MNTNIDYQWPSSFCQTKKFNEQLAHENTEAIYSEIESFFKSVFHKDCVLFPSGRGLISQILKYNKIGRSKLVFAPKWSPYCVLNAIAFHSNITSELTNKVDVMIANHKWGVAKEVDSDKFGLVIEDSVDSIIQSKDFLFPNGGKYEIISLPKVIGSYSGAILFSKDLNFFDYIKNRIGKNKGLAIRQSRVRNKIMMGESNHHDVWNEGEMINYSLDYNALIDIRGKLMNFKINKEIIISRLEKLVLEIAPLIFFFPINT